MYTQGHSRLISSGAFLPSNRISSREVMEQFDSKNRYAIPYEWLERTTGIRERRAAPSDLKPSDMAARAAFIAMERGGVLAKDVDAIIYAGMFRDLIEPATAHLVQDKIKAQNSIAFDVTNACLGFMSAIHVMDSLIATGQVRRGLVVTGEQGYRYTRATCETLASAKEPLLDQFYEMAINLTLGDAGAALLMGPKLSPDSGFMGFMVRSEGRHHDLCFCEPNGLPKTKIAEIVKNTASLVPPMYHELMGDHLKWKSADLKRYIPHQVGVRTTKRHADELDISLDKIPLSVDVLGNIISASIPANIAALQDQNAMCQGDKIYLAGSGSGISISQAGLIWDAA